MKSFASAVRSRYTRSMDERAVRLDPDVRRELAEEIETTLKIQPSEEEEEQHGAGAGAGGVASSPPRGENEEADAEEYQEDNFETEEDETDVAIAELDFSLKESKAGLAKSEEAERFLGTRVGAYRRMLDGRAANLDRMDEGSVRSGGGGGGGAGEEEGLLPSDGGGGASADGRGGGDEEKGEGGLATLGDDDIRALREKQQRDEEALDKVVEMHRGILADVERMRRKITDLEKKREEIIERRDECRDFLVAAAQAEESEAMGGGVGGGGVGSCPLTLPTIGKENAPAEKNEDRPDPERVESSAVAQDRVSGSESEELCAASRGGDKLKNESSMHEHDD